MMKIIKFLVIFFVASLKHVSASPEMHFRTETINMYEHYTMRVSPDLFNWTFSVHEQFRYRPSLRGKATLPSWLNYQFSKDRDLGYIYGTPTSNQANKKFEIEVVGLNKQTYETRRIIIPFEVVKKAEPANKIEMKITNLNWVQLTDSGPVKSLKGIFIDDLWPESAVDLNVTYMESAVRLGSRVPLKPQNREGIIVHLGSNQALSTRLMELNEEIKPLSKLSTCTFKKTKVESVFQNAGFQVDWCAFKIITEGQSPSLETIIEEASMLHQKIWNAPSRDELPDRNYSEEIAVALAIPSVWFAFLVALLTVVMCFQHDKLRDEESNKFFHKLFDVCCPAKESDEPKPSSQPVQMVQYSGTNKTPPTTTLKSLHDPYDDNLSLGSQSPTGSIFREGSPQTNGSFMRPKPPAYKGKAGESSASIVRFERDI